MFNLSSVHMYGLLSVRKHLEHQTTFALLFVTNLLPTCTWQTEWKLSTPGNSLSDIINRQLHPMVQ